MPDIRVRQAAIPRSGMSLVEVLVVVGVVAILMALMLVAIQSVRESARRAQCASNLRQIALGCITHEQYRGHYPTGGWGHAWVGIPDRGSDNKQPGGWIYNVLPFIEQSHIYEMGRGLTGAERASASTQRLKLTVPLMNCSSRRRPDVWPTATYLPHLRDPRETNTVLAVARSDYAINAGSVRVFSSFEGPLALTDGDRVDYSWPDTSLFTGVSFLRSQVNSTAITGGLGHEYLVGEKYLDPLNYFTGMDQADNESMYNGFCSDLDRYANQQFTPMQDRFKTADPYRFGSAHSGGCSMSFCDGRVVTIAYDIDPVLHECQGNRNSDCSNLAAP
ncbi:MAG: DUF1559 domain-containing protein [Planctomycetes bacterium]|nr:DUF1559 domain-containing protein [Planctomycetota bacterium]